jgi:hypothetical protein
MEKNRVQPDIHDEGGIVLRPRNCARITMLKLMKAYLPMCMLLAAVAGCQSMQWSRADTSEAQLQADSQNCQNKAMSTNQTARLQPNTPDGL